MKEKLEQTLNIGEHVNVDILVNGKQEEEWDGPMIDKGGECVYSTLLTYAGMPTKNTFSFILSKKMREEDSFGDIRTFKIQGNLYFNVGDNVKIEEEDFDIKHIDNKQIIIKYIKKGE